MPINNLQVYAVVDRPNMLLIDRDEVIEYCCIFFAKTGVLDDFTRISILKPYSQFTQIAPKVLISQLISVVFNCIGKCDRIY